MNGCLASAPGRARSCRLELSTQPVGEPQRGAGVRRGYACALPGCFCPGPSRCRCRSPPRDACRARDAARHHDCRPELTERPGEPEHGASHNRRRGEWKADGEETRAGEAPSVAARPRSAGRRARIPLARYARAAAIPWRPSRAPPPSREHHVDATAFGHGPMMPLLLSSVSRIRPVATGGSTSGNETIVSTTERPQISTTSE